MHTRTATIQISTCRSTKNNTSKTYRGVAHQLDACSKQTPCRRSWHERGDGCLAQVGPNRIAVGTLRALASHSWSGPLALSVACRTKQGFPKSEPANHALNKTPYVFLRWLETRAPGMDESMRVENDNGPAPRGLNAVAIIQEPVAPADGRSTRG